MSAEPSPFQRVHLSDFEPVPAALLDVIPLGLIKKSYVVPVAKNNGHLIVAVSDTGTTLKPEGLKMVAGCPVDLVMAPIDEIIEFIKTHYPETMTPPSLSNAPPAPKAAAPKAPTPEEATNPFLTPPLSKTPSASSLPNPFSSPSLQPRPAVPAPAVEEKPRGVELRDSVPINKEDKTVVNQEKPSVRQDTPVPPVLRVEMPEPPVVKNESVLGFITRMFSNAAKNEATAMVVESSRDRIRVRQRIRGVLITTVNQAWSDSNQTEFLSILLRDKAHGAGEGLQYLETAFQFPAGGRVMEGMLVWSASPDKSLTTFKFRPVMEKTFSPEEWGMGPHQNRLLENFLAARQGLLLFCGLDNDVQVESVVNACANQRITPENHVINVSLFGGKPSVQYLSLSAGGDEELYSRLLSHAFRHAPDVVCANSLRRKKDVEAAMLGALEGRLVIARFPARDSADMLVQFVGMGIDPYLMGSSVLGIVAQRQMRLICSNCREKEMVTREQLKEAGVLPAMQPPSFFRGKGCEKCLNTGFDSETTLFEVLPVTEELRAELQRELRFDAVRNSLKAGGLMTLRQIALHKAINGQTSLSEAIRATA